MPVSAVCPHILLQLILSPLAGIDAAPDGLPPLAEVCCHYVPARWVDEACLHVLIY